jgi:phosphatidate cytidylyltransferase
MITRIFIGFLLIASLLGLLYADEYFTGATAKLLPMQHIPAGGILFAASALIILPLLALELSRMLRAINPDAPGFVWTLCVALCAFIIGCEHLFHWVIIAWLAGNVLLLTLLPSLIAALSKKWFTALTGLGYWVLISVWIGWLPSYWIDMRSTLPAWALAWAVLTVKSGDIGAYFTGVALGKNRMAAWVSPKKSWEGLAGAIILSCLVGAGLTYALGQSILVGVAFGALAAFIGMLGDLAESILKREALAKDSGRILPGMGGVFDVMDSLLATAPLAVWLLAKSSAPVV